MGNLIVDRVQSREMQQIRYKPRQSWRARNSASPRTPSIPARKRSCLFLKSHRNPRFKSFRPMNPGTSPLRLRVRSERRRATALHFSSKLCILCNWRSPAEPHGPPGLQVRLHYIRICTKKGHKARRREGDKCFFRCFFLLPGTFSARLQHPTSTETGFVAPGGSDAPHGQTQPKLATTTKGKIFACERDFTPKATYQGV